MQEKSYLYNSSDFEGRDFQLKIPGITHFSPREYFTTVFSGDEGAELAELAKKEQD